MKLTKDKKIVYFSSLLVMGVLAGLFLNSFCWPYREMSIRKVAVGCIVFFLVAIVPILTVKIKFLYEWVLTVVQRMECTREQMRKDKKKIGFV